MPHSTSCRQTRRRTRPERDKCFLLVYALDIRGSPLTGVLAGRAAGFAWAFLADEPSAAGARQPRGRLLVVVHFRPGRTSDGVVRFIRQPPRLPKVLLLVRWKRHDEPP